MKQKEILAYKAFNRKEGEYYICEGTDHIKKYRMGHSHYHRGKLSVCKSGLHCSEKLGDVYDYKPYSSHVCLVRVRGETQKLQDKICCGNMHLIRELTETQIVRQILSDFAEDFDVYDKTSSLTKIPGILKHRKLKNKRRLMAMVDYKLREYLKYLTMNKPVTLYSHSYFWFCGSIFGVICELTQDNPHDFNYVVDLIKRMPGEHNAFKTRLLAWIRTFVDKNSIDALYVKLSCNNLPNEVADILIKKIKGMCRSSYKYLDALSKDYSSANKELESLRGLLNEI
jgi:hypothetical protein